MSEHHALDSVYNQKLARTHTEFSVLNDVYALDTVSFETDVSKAFFDYTKERKFFVLLAIFDATGRILLKRTVDPMGWELPGGSIRRNETTYEAAVRIVHNEIPALPLGEIEPVAQVCNTFKHDGQVHTHDGVALLVRKRGHGDVDPEHELRFVDCTQPEIDAINRFANKRVVEIAKKRISEFDLERQDNEIEANEAARWRYILHNKLIKRTLLTSSRKRNHDRDAIYFQQVQGCERILDVSAGDSSLANRLIHHEPSITAFFANDISWSQLQLAQSDHPKIFYSNHDAVYLPFKGKSFDLGICANTLHHLRSREHVLRLLSSMDRVCKSMFFWEIDDPKKDSIIPKILNKYLYESFLGDQGFAYFDENQFAKLMNGVFRDRQLQFGRFTNVQGTYNYVRID